MYEKAIFIFRRDLRLYDNAALQEACKQARVIIPCFIFDPVQVDASNKYRSMNALQYMIESLVLLHKELKKAKGTLFFLHGSAPTVVEKLIAKTGADALFFNKDYTPFSIKRDKKLEQICKQRGVACHSYDDALLHAPDTIVKKDSSPYGVFTAFYNRARVIPVAKPQKFKSSSWYSHKITGALAVTAITKTILGPYKNSDCMVHGGRKEALSALRNLKNFGSYTKTRDIPSLSTTHLSAHLKFGTVSVREAYDAIGRELGPHHPLRRQLYWRDFWTYIAYHNPHVFGHAYHERYDNLQWDNSRSLFKKWCEGRTGFPIVDAGMRELNATGFMHNRVRMIVASFLTKDLHIDWRWGERYFAQQLVDYDPSLNNGNWQWAASTGCDAQPYFRIFNPWLQQKKFDPACAYIKRWIPELKDVDTKTIHAAYKKEIADYPQPCIDHAVESAKAKAWYKKAKK